MNRRIRNRMYGGVGGRRAKAFLLPDYGICNEQELISGCVTGKSTRIKSSFLFQFILGNTPPVPVYAGFFKTLLNRSQPSQF